MRPVKLPGTPVAWRGDPLTIQVNVWTDESKTTGRDLTTFGSTWAAQLRTEIDEFDPAATFTIDDTDAATGKLVLTLTGSQTQALARTGTTPYGWDVQATDDDGVTSTIVTGSLATDGDWTR